MHFAKMTLILRQKLRQNATSLPGDSENLRPSPELASTPIFCLAPNRLR
jgi:hypothetical protein